MQFVRHGPDIPERLLQEHEDGHVVFFCGAGISYPAGLPGFGGLVDLLYQQVGEPPDSIEADLVNGKQFDQAIGRYEHRIQGGRQNVRRWLPVVLDPDLRKRRSLTTHFALLTLAQSRNNGLRLVTTNFDTLFEEAARHYGFPGLTVYPDPPARARWEGVVHLHGRMPDAPNDNDLDRLILSDGDFGQAYLTQGWAARFVGTLFRDFTLCFVGYSIDDPVLRYMTAAHALGDGVREMFAFAPCSNGETEFTDRAWRAKNVVPIIYDDAAFHRKLHETLHVWASIHRDGIRGKERLVVRLAMRDPTKNSPQNDFVGRLLWAISDSGGLPAKRFADLNPVPSLEWLEPFAEERYLRADLDRFGVPPKPSTDRQLAFSLTCRPLPYDRAPRMVLVGGGHSEVRWDDVMPHLARWLTRHLDDPMLVLWLAKRGGQLHPNLASLIEDRLDYLDKLDRDHRTEEIDRIRANAPRAVPRPTMRTLWRLMLAGRVRSTRHDPDFYRWLQSLKRDGPTTALRLQLREILTPRVSLREPYRWTAELGAASEPSRLTDLVEWEVVLSADHVHSRFRDLSNNPQWTKSLPDLLSDFSALLRDTLDLMRELGGAEDRSDLSYVHQPSISEHPQNKHFRDWTALIDLTRDAWLATAAKTPGVARLVAEAWWQVPYPVFRRLAFFAAAQGHVIPHRMALDWLLADNHWWLWSVETQREAFRLVVALAPSISTAAVAELEQAILDGPPRVMFRDDIELETWTNVVERGVWLRLAKLDASGASLGAIAKARLDELSDRKPQWKLAADGQDEFPYWTWGGWMGERDPWRSFQPTPRRRRAVLDYLRTYPVLEGSQQDDWKERCRESFQATAYALCTLAREDTWPEQRWQDALQAWTDEKLIEQSWRYMASMLADAPDDLLRSVAPGVSFWLRNLAKTFDGHDELFLILCRRTLAIEYQSESDTYDPVGQAINHPVGHVTEALLRWWYRQPLEDGQGLPAELSSIFTELCDPRIDKFRHARVLLVAHVIALFRVDHEWATQHLLPLFEWQRSEVEARAAWEGFLWSPRLYRPLIEAIKKPFLDTARHYAALGNHGDQYAELLTFAALDPGEAFTKDELADATRSLPADGLHSAAQALVRALEGAGEQRAEYWKNRVVPYLQSIWPKSRDRVTPEISESLGLLCVAARDAFPEAVMLLRFSLQPPEHPHYLLHRIREADLCGRFPDSALEFLDLVVRDGTGGLGMDLKPCLEALREADPKLEGDGRFQHLWEYLRRFGLA